MATTRQYFGIENIPTTGLTAQQKQTLINGLLTIGANENSPQPCERMHTRVRNDNDAVIFEALVNEDNLTVLAIRTRLANLFSVALNTITTSVNQVPSIGPVTTFSHSGVPKIRMVAFGHNGTNWGTTAQSKAAALDYLASNAAEWEPAA
jgi:hypothetical protein